MKIVSNSYFITGAEGAGKSSLVPLIKKRFPNIDVHDFDSVGVPPNPQLQWRLDTTLHWIKIALKNQEKNKSTCIIGLSFPSEVEEFEESKKLNKILYCLLDMHEKERKKRLRKRNTPEMIEDLEQLNKLREDFKQTKYKTNIIDTSNLSLNEVANEIIDWLR
ncbi:MAG: hypothetical protein IIA87_04230 [Nanoarchaeota archaeon]|nr:hypothetical protein [Nanoarchaeota archaeon]